MKKLLFSLHLAIYMSHINAMTPYTEHKAGYSILPQEIRHHIIYCATVNTTTEKPKEATKAAKTLSYINKQFNTDINHSEFTNNLIISLSHKYRCAHQTITRYLKTPQARRVLTLQYKLRRLCFAKKDDDLALNLKKLIAQGVNLEFTYNHDKHQKTPLMISMHHNNNMFSHLLQHGANINGCNSHGITAFHLAISTRSNKRSLIQLAQNGNLNINQQNKRGENVLLHYITHIKKTHINESFIATIINLLIMGVDPEQANIKGLTPLEAAQKLNSPITIGLIKDAIAARKAASHA